MIRKINFTKCLLTFGVVILLVSTLTPLPANAKEAVNVAVLPFTINAKKNLSYLKPQIAEVLSGHLEKEGASIVRIIDFNTITVPELQDSKSAAGIGRKLGANQVVWGSFTLIEDRFILNARLTNTKDTGKASAFSIKGKSLENLLGVLKVLANKINLKLFEYDTIADIKIQGNRRIESDAILRVVQSKVNGIFKKETLSKDIRNIFAMGYFDNVRVESASAQKGKIITFHVEEKPTIRRIKLKGNLKYKDEEIKENLTITTGSILNIFKIRNNIVLIEELYKEKNYHKIKIKYNVLPLKNNQADLEFVIDEGPKLYVTKIVFDGNKAFDRKKLLKEIKTSEKGFFYWISSSGDLDRTTLDQDMAKLNAFYHNQGFIRSRIADPAVNILTEHIQITIKINEGPQFKVGEVKIEGDLIKKKQVLLQELSITEETYFSREKIRNDINTLSDIYGDHGYAHADIRPLIEENEKNLAVDIRFVIDKKQKVYLENIIISGNTRTRDKVIRRLLRVQEQGLFKAASIKRSIRSLLRLDYFEDIKVNHIKGSSEDKMSLKIDVTEKPTGTFSFGAGYSSEESIFLMASIAQRNFLGRGQTLQLSGKVGSSTREFVLRFTEPWFMDSRLSVTGEAYNLEKDYTYYDRDSYGALVRFGYPVFDYTRAYMGYNYELNDIAIDDYDEAPDDMIFLEGTNLTSKAQFSLEYDSRDRRFNPTEGSKHRALFEYAGLGGKIGYNKYILNTGSYYPIYKGIVGYAHAKTGYVHANDRDKYLPDYEKFELGGINSLRGFDSVNIEKDGKEYGGHKMVQFNLELIVPLYEKLGLMGVVFYDTGNVYDDNIDFSDMRQSAGGGFRWYSPLAPIRIEYGHILDRREDESSGRWEFTVGGEF
ncbi:MAG: outer membrane protein assembly factor BamA [Desulfobacteraceae bacterium]|nr:outer membrane protein assembly factor BamA [Desulfobacteraceae bacterium]